jgi:hypothetical protein
LFKIRLKKTYILIILYKLNLYSESEMISRCDGDEQCLYDAKAIGILEVGEMTKNNHRYYKFLDEAMKPGKFFRFYFKTK